MNATPNGVAQSTSLRLFYKHGNPLGSFALGENPEGIKGL